MLSNPSPDVAPTVSLAIMYLMSHRLTLALLLLATAFALAHAFAVTVSLYWYYWWFDIVMHLWGGLLIALGIHALSSFRWFPFRPTTKTVLLGLLCITIGWEIFEWSVGLYDPNAYMTSTLKDLFFGFSGGLLAHAMLRSYRIK
jgi:fatty-acid desaturase